MDAATVVFLVVGAVAIGLLALSLLVGEFFSLHAHVDVADGWISLPVVAGFVGALGFGAAIAAELVPGDGAADVVVGLAVGVAAAVPTAWFAGRLVRAAQNMRTDATPSRAHLIGALGVVVSPVPADGYGEVRLSVGGAPMKFNARSATPLKTGTRVFVIDVPTETSVVVEEAASFLPSTPPEQKDR